MFIFQHLGLINGICNVRHRVKVSHPGCICVPVSPDIEPDPPAVRWAPGDHSWESQTDAEHRCAQTPAGKPAEATWMEDKKKDLWSDRKRRKKKKKIETHLWQNVIFSMLSVTRWECNWGSSSFSKAASNSEKQHLTITTNCISISANNRSKRFGNT